MNIDGISNKSITQINNDVKKVSNSDRDSNKSFASYLKDSVSNVNKLQNQANQASKDLALGKADNVHEVMVASQKAKLSVDLTAQVSNKAVSAYQEIMGMQV